MDLGQRLRALPEQPLTAAVVQGAMDPSDDRLAAYRIADQVRITQRRR